MSIDVRVATTPDLDPFLDELIGDGGVFRSKQKALMFAASLAASSGDRRALEKRAAGAAIRWDIFEKNADDDYIGALSVHERRDLKALSPTEIRGQADLFEEYAHAGLRLLRARGAHHSLDAMLALIEDHRHASAADEIVGVDPDVLATLLR